MGQNRRSVEHNPPASVRPVHTRQGEQRCRRVSGPRFGGRQAAPWVLPSLANAAPVARGPERGGYAVRTISAAVIAPNFSTAPLPAPPGNSRGRGAQLHSSFCSGRPRGAQLILAFCADPRSGSPLQRGRCGRISWAPAPAAAVGRRCEARAVPATQAYVSYVEETGLYAAKQMRSNLIGPGPGRGSRPRM